MDKVTTGTVRTEASRVEGFAVFSLKLWMSVDSAKFLLAMGKLTLVAVLARSDLCEASAQFSLVSRRRSKRLGSLSAARGVLLLRRLAETAIQLFVWVFAVDVLP